MSAHRVQQHQNRLCDWTVVAPDMEPAQQGKGIGDVLGGGVELTAVNRMHRMQSADPQLAIRAKALAIGEKGVIAEREHRSTQGGIDPQLVVRPLDCREGVAQRDDLLAIVKRAAADENVRDASRLERADIGPGDVSRKVPKATKQNANMARANSNRVPILLHSPAACVHQPFNERTNSI